jgi:hypothetical protein
MEYQFLERISCKTLLGIRFWDVALDTPVSDDLQVTLHALDYTRKKISAFRTRSGVYAFASIPGMISHETQAESGISSPQTIRSFVVEVFDTKRCFTPAAFMVDLPLPYNGIFLVDDTNASPALTPRGFNLYSSPHRPVAPQFTFLRGDLIDRNTELPAAHALIRVENEEGLSWYGIADADGKFAVMLPYPLLHIAFGSSPPFNDGIRLTERSWSLTVTVLYEPLNLTSLPGSDLPEYSSILSQGQGFLYTESPDTDVGETSELQAELVYGRDVVVTTAGFSELYVSASGSPA